MSLVMHLQQYGTIEDCILDPVYGTVEVRDPAAWHVEEQDSLLVVRGLFVHSVAFYASPPDGRLYVDDTLAVDATGATAYALTFGPHRLRAEAIGFDPLDTTIVVSSRTPPFIPVVLARPVRISAFDPRHPQSDLRVLVDRLEGPERTIYVRRFTPYSVRIPAMAYTATLRKRNYRDTTVYIPPELTSVTVFMTPVGGSTGALERSQTETPVVRTVPDRAPDPAPRVTADRAPWVRIQVSARGRTSLEGAEIWARASSATQETFLGTTDAQGELRVQMAPGNYDLLAYLDLYSGIRKRVKVRESRNRPLQIELNR
jgi:hypothetical protein